MGKTCPLCNKDYEFSSIIQSCPLEHCPKCGSAKLARPNWDGWFGFRTTTSLFSAVVFGSVGGVYIGTAVAVYFNYLVGLLIGALVVAVPLLISYIYLGHRVCTECGTKFILPKKNIRLEPSRDVPTHRVCPRCGARMPIGARFCGRCQARL
jgi:ribosomal protein L32